MNEIQYNQILCCSSEKSATTGLPGFGVRAKSQGLTIEVADEIYLKSGVRYSLPIDKMATAELVRSTPHLDTLYPHNYIFQELQLTDGSVKYIIARVMYAGADYGFFSESGNNNRVGANYIAHLLVFDEEPSVALFTAALKQRCFYPLDTACTFDNPDFKRILTGDVFELPVGRIQPVSSGDAQQLVDVNLLIAMLQAYKNTQCNREIRNVIYKTTCQQVERIISDLSLMPSQLTRQLFFNANVMGQSSVPQGLRLIIVNDKDETETLDDYHIVVDARKENVVCKNIEQDFLLDKIRETAARFDVNEVNLIVQLFMQLCAQPDANEVQAYRVMIMSRTADPVTLQDIMELDLPAVVNLHMSQEESTRFWAKFKVALDEAISFPLKVSELKNALRIISQLRTLAPNRIGDVSGYGKVIKRVIFDPKYYNMAIGEDMKLLDVVLYILGTSKVELPTEEALYNVLLSTRNVEVWKKLLGYFYGGERGVMDHLENVVDAIMADATKQSYSKALELYPMAVNSKDWIDLVNRKPGVLPLIKNELDDFLKDGLEEDPKRKLRTILELSPDVLKSLSPVFRSVVDIHNEVLIKKPTYSDIKMAERLDSKQRYLLSMYETWTKGDATKQEVAEFISNYSQRSETTASLLEIVWKNTPASSRESVFLWITDHLKLKHHRMKSVRKILKPEAAKELLEKEKGFFKTLCRKLFGFSYILLCIVCSTLLLSCSGKQTKVEEVHQVYYSPFRVEYYGDTVGVKDVTIFDTNKKRQWSSKKFRAYSATGLLTLETVDLNSGVVDSTIYSYDTDDKVVEIRDTKKTYSDFQYNDKYQLSSYKTTQVVKGKSITESYSLTYNDDNLVTQIAVLNASGDTVRKSDYAYQNQKLQKIRESEANTIIETTFDVENGRLISANTFNAKGKLQLSKLFTYEGEYSGAKSYYCTAKFKNSKGVALGSYVFQYNRYDENTPVVSLSETAEVSKPKQSSNFITGYFHALSDRITRNRLRGHAPNVIVGIVAWILAIAAAITYFILCSDWYLPFGGEYQKNGMKRTWVFNIEPYWDATLTVLILLAAFLSSLIVLLTVGGLTYLILWIVKLLLIVLVYAGMIACVLGIIGALLIPDGDGKGCGCGTAIIGGVLWAFSDPIFAFGDMCVKWGFDFMSALNLYGWTKDLFVYYWDVILLACVTPLLTFIGVALLIMLLVALLSGTEWIVMKVYGVSRPCPVCGSKSSKEYWVDRMHQHPVKLHPGVYGIFRHTNPVTHEKLPTLLLTGKGRLLRRCPSCGNFINADTSQSYGTEKHVGIVGHRSSGKSYLTYTILGRIMNMYGSSASQIDVDSDTRIESNVARIRNNDGIQTDVRDSYRAIQVILKQKLRPIPYHLFFYDVAGEKFNQTSSASKTAMDFYKNVNQIIFIVDPTTIDFSHAPCSDTMQAWLKDHASSEHYSVDGTFSTLKSILESVGRQPKSIDVIFALVKADMGYIDYCGGRLNMTDEEVKNFMQSELGLANLVNAARGSFNKVEFVITSVESGYSERINVITDKILHNLGVK